MAKKLYYKIGEACRKLEIQPYVLRYWETEFPSLNPEKSRSGQRTYGEADIRTIGRIKELLYEEGYTIAGAKKKLEAELASGKEPRPIGKSAPAKKKAPAKEAEEAKEPEAAEEADPKPKEAAPEPKAAPKKPAQKAVPKAKKTAEAPPTKPAADPESKARIASLEKGIEQALAEARNILDLLDSKSASE